MPIFQYQGVDAQGHPISGAMLATDEKNLEKNLRSAGCWLISSELAKPAVTGKRRRARGWGFLDFGRVSRRDLIDFCTLVSYQTKVGVTLVQALDVAGQDCDNPRFRMVINSVRRDVENGALFNEALAKHPKIFSRQVISVVKAGETSSKLPETFGDLRDYLEWLDQVIGDVRQASIYPSVVLGVVCGFVLFLFSYIIPKFVSLLEASKSLPFVTQVVFGVSDFAKKTWWIWVLSIVTFMLVLKIGRKTSRRFAIFVDRIKIQLPVLGEINWMLSISRFTHNLGLLYKAGIPIMNALHLCREVVGNALVENAVGDLERNVAAGGQISEVMRRHPVFPSMLLRMVIMGESTGNLDAALENVSSYYNDIIPRRIKKLFSLLEPALMVFLVFLVGTVALSIFLPIISLMNGIK